MVSKRVKLDIIALVSTIVFNCLLTGFIGEIEIVGLFVAPAIGGFFRSIIAHKKDLLFIIPGMFFLDTILFVP